MISTAKGKINIRKDISFVSQRMLINLKQFPSASRSIVAQEGKI